MVLHGGAGFNGVGGAVTYSDTWELSGGQWVLKQQTAPFPPRSGSAMVFNQDRGRTWLIGGKSGGVPFGDVWEWDGTAWVLLPTSGLAPRAFHMAAYSEATGEVFVYGGSPDGLVYPKRVSRIATVTSPRIARSPVGATRCLGSPIDDISVDATGIGLTYQWRKDGASLNGQTASALNIPQCAMTDAGIYDCVVSNSCGSATSNPATVRVLPDIRPNGQIDTADLTLFLAFFGFTTPSIADFNGDGLVNTVDLIRFLGAFGQTCN
ncbi:MAG: GC-type dockerin domain-anchored protein [Phycisphaerales bacterium]